jgi:hypothetical protein
MPPRYFSPDVVASLPCRCPSPLSHWHHHHLVLARNYPLSLVALLPPHVARRSIVVVYGASQSQCLPRATTNVSPTGAQLRPGGFSPPLPSHARTGSSKSQCPTLALYLPDAPLPHLPSHRECLNRAHHAAHPPTPSRVAVVAPSFV